MAIRMVGCIIVRISRFPRVRRHRREMCEWDGGNDDDGAGGGAAE